MLIRRITEKRVLTILALMVSCLLAGNALADGNGANKRADFGQNTAASAREQGDAMKEAGKDAAKDASDEMNAEKDKAVRKTEKEERKARKKAEKEASKNTDKAERKAKQAQKEAGDLKDAAVKDATDTSNEAKGALDRMTAPEQLLPASMEGGGG